MLESSFQQHTIADNDYSRVTTTGEDFQDESIQDEDSSMMGVIFNALNLISGSSLVGLPYALKESGLILGLFFFIAVSYYTFHPILHKYPIHSYEDLVSIPFGKMGEYILMFSVFFVSLGGTVGYLIMIKDAMPVRYHSNSNQRKILLFSVWIFFIIPLTFLKNVKSFEYLSGFSLLLTIILIIVIISQCPLQESIESQGGLLPLIQEYGFCPNMFTTISIVMDSIAWQHGSFIVFHSLTCPTLSRWRLVTSSVNYMACFLYACVAIPGYIGYLNNTQGTIFLNLPMNTISNIARVFFSFIIVMIYPIDMIIARDLVLSFIRRNDIVDHMEPYSKGSLNSYTWRQYFICGREIIIVMILNITALTLSLLFGDLGKVLTYTGAIGGGITCFIVAPGAIYIGVNGREFLKFIKIRLSLGDSEGYHMSSEETSFQLKPWWYGFLGFPVWCRLAHVGMTNVQRKALDHAGPIAKIKISDFSNRPGSNDETVIQPTATRFVQSMILVTFGVVNMIVSITQGILRE